MATTALDVTEGATHPVEHFCRDVRFVASLVTTEPTYQIHCKAPIFGGSILAPIPIPSEGNGECNGSRLQDRATQVDSLTLMLRGKATRKPLRREQLAISGARGHLDYCLID